MPHGQTRFANISTLKNIPDFWNKKFKSKIAERKREILINLKILDFLGERNESYFKGNKIYANCIHGH